MTEDCSELPKKRRWTVVSIEKVTRVVQFKAGINEDELVDFYLGGLSSAPYEVLEEELEVYDVLDAE